MRKKDVCLKIARWALLISEFNCDVTHRAGTAMRHADALSRLPITIVVETCILYKIKVAQSQDDRCKLIIKVFATQTITLLKTICNINFIKNLYIGYTEKYGTENNCGNT